MRFGLESPHNSSLSFTERSDAGDFNPVKEKRKKEFQASSPDEIALV